MSRFEDRLWAELVEQHGALLADPPAGTLAPERADRIAPAGRIGPSDGFASAPGSDRAARAGREARRPAGRRRLAAAAAATLTLAAAIAALVIALGSSGGGTPAYAVVQNPNGTISVTINEIVGLQGASEKLASLGVPVRVVPYSASCTTRAGEYPSAHIDSDLAERISTTVGGPGAPSIVITPSLIPAGDTVVIGARSLGPSNGGLSPIGLQSQIFKGPGPPCLALGPGG